MAFDLTAKAELLSEKNKIKPQIILEIDGIDTVFGAITVTKLVKIGDEGLEIGNDWVIGGVTDHPDQKNYISLDKTTKNITQQLLQDKGGTGSVSRVRINLVDKNEEITALFQPGNKVDDVLSARAKVYLNFERGAHPEDSIQIFDGIIADMNFGAGFIEVIVSHPEEQKRQKIFRKVKTKLDDAIDSSTTDIKLDDGTGLLPDQTNYFTPYVRIGDELIKYTNVQSDNTLLSPVRGSLGTTAASHDDGDEVESFYVLEHDNAIELALMIMLSPGNTPYIDDLSVDRFERVDSDTVVQNAVVFDDPRLVEKHGITVGDKIALDTFGVAQHKITEVFEGNNLVYFVLDKTTITLTETLSPGAKADFFSEWALLGDGLEMKPREVDVKEHIATRDLLTTGVPGYKFYLRDTVEGQKFVNEELYFPAGIYQVPRKGRASLGVTLPPLAKFGTKFIDETNVKSPSKIKMQRSINKHFYNEVIYFFEEKLLDEQLQRTSFLEATDSKDRLNTGKRPLELESRGLRDDSATNLFLDLQKRRFLDRYQFAAESTKFEVLYGVGFNIEVGDTVVFGSPSLKVSDLTRGDRKFKPRIMEVINKKLNVVSGNIELELLDTAFSIDRRYGVISPSSKIKSGASTTKLPLKKSYGTGDLEKERDKWEDLIDQKVIVHDADWTQQDTTTFTGFDSVDENTMTLSPALSFTPSEDYIVDVAHYDDSDSEAQELLKTLFVFGNPQVDVASGASSTEFTVATGEGSKFKVGQPVRVHDFDYSTDSGETKVASVSGDTITVEDDLGFTPSSSEVVDLIGFVDDGLPYAYV